MLYFQVQTTRDPPMVSKAAITQEITEVSKLLIRHTSSKNHQISYSMQIDSYGSLFTVCQKLNSKKHDMELQLYA